LLPCRYDCKTPCAIEMLSMTPICLECGCWLVAMCTSRQQSTVIKYKYLHTRWIWVPFPALLLAYQRKHQAVRSVVSDHSSVLLVRYLQSGSDGSNRSIRQVARNAFGRCSALREHTGGQRQILLKFSKFFWGSTFSVRIFRNPVLESMGRSACDTFDRRNFRRESLPNCLLRSDAERQSDPPSQRTCCCSLYPFDSE
jgi:hypothetical protein